MYWICFEKYGADRRQAIPRMLYGCSPVMFAGEDASVDRGLPGTS